VNENGLAHRLRKAGIKVEQLYPLQVVDEDGAILGDFICFNEVIARLPLLSESRN